jgi:hypothetical protein
MEKIYDYVPPEVFQLVGMDDHPRSIYQGKQFLFFEMFLGWDASKGRRYIVIQKYDLKRRKTEWFVGSERKLKGCEDGDPDKIYDAIHKRTVKRSNRVEGKDLAARLKELAK